MNLCCAVVDNAPVVAVGADGQETVTGNSLKPLEEMDNLTDEMFNVITELDTCYSDMTLLEERRISDIKERLCILEEKVLIWDSDQLMTSDMDSEEIAKYLQAGDELRQLIEHLGNLQSSDKDGEQIELLNRSHSIMQMAMSRLEDVLVHLLVQHRQPVEPDHMSFHSTEEDIVTDYSSSSFDDESIDGEIQSDAGRDSEDFVIDLIHPSAISSLKSIAELMFQSNYDKECCQAYISVRKAELDECLAVLGMEKLGIEEILRMDWNVLSIKTKWWNRAMKVFIRVYLVSEKHLCDLILGNITRSETDYCFVESSRNSIMQLLNFGEAVAIGPPKPEKLFRILDMYECLNDLLVDVEALFPGEYGSSILTECHEVLLRLSESARGSFMEFKYAIRSNTSTTPFAGGRVHPLTKYVMNYIKALAVYGKTLDLLLEDLHENDQISAAEDDRRDTSVHSSPTAWHLLSVTSILESNLEVRSMLYQDGPLQNFFMMNNIYYMFQKVVDSDLQNFLGDEWIRAYKRKFRQHATSYERASWNPVLSFLKDEGICSRGSSTPSTTVLKERFKSFNLALEEVYRIQTAWFIPDVQLRDELRISISLKVLQAYRTFLGRYSVHLDGTRHRDRYIKYCPDDLERYLLDLFEGLPKSLQCPYWR
ncbi:exocyst complex component EXO70E2-like [Phoenix dactylifera]|uniref:Exocyst subunit Exo70 family protein n=1 Tax=Phoenix dactylifera TaxID=42345 RepID=A0A8B7CRV2_PHODC|nr:exocyst complex component EXO70E2-like [Phoenix dactylifera]XP_008805132.2 exocyst complex component EXO70E2-like [Phoenix dactylifera]XP_008805133.2 exocyst complex component EXO70E2-like [Phoenix dactylifera]